MLGYGRMSDIPEALIGDFIDAAVNDHGRAQTLLAAHPELLNARWIHDETVLHFLAVEGFVRGVKFLVEHGADVNAVNEFGDSALIDVTTLGNVDIARLLLAHGADPNATSRTRDNPLHTAAQGGNATLVALLLEAGADARSRTDLDESIFDVVPFEGEERESVLAALAKFGITPDEE